MDDDISSPAQQPAAHYDLGAGHGHGRPLGGGYLINRTLCRSSDALMHL
jgi:hypothetical protein